MEAKKIKEKLIDNGVKNLIEFGYEGVSKHNIMTDEVYSLFFKSMLEENIGVGPATDKVINELIDQIAS